MVNEDITKLQLQNIHRYGLQIIDDLPDRALAELTGGYDQDYEKLIGEMFGQISTVMNIPKTLDTEKLEYLQQLEASMDRSLKKLSYNYFKTTVLPSFRQGHRNLEWGNLIQLYFKLGMTAQRGSGKCFAKGTEVLMYDGTIKCIEDISVGDRLMGKDNSPRTVLKLHSGEDDMFEVEQKQSLNYIVNSKHDIYYKKWKREKRRIVYDVSKAIDVVIEARDFAKKSKSYKENIFGVKVEGWELSKKNLKIDPYWLGYWLGDGTASNTEIATIEPEVVKFLNDHASKLGMINQQYCNNKLINKAVAYRRGSKPKKNILLERLRYYNLLNNKHIPEIYLLSSKEDRFQLLAGLIDSDGNSPKDKKNTYIFTQKSKDMMYQIQRLCWSLGFRCNITEYTYKTKYTKSGEATTFQMHISGEIWNIPCKVERKKAAKQSKIKPPNRCGLDIKNIGRGKYYGFTCDKDHMFLLKDGTIVKNSYEMCFALPLWRLYSYDRPKFFLTDTVDNKNRKETLMVTNVETLGREHADKIVEEIKYNDVLSDKLNPNNKATLGNKKIITETGSMLHVRGAFGFSRGLHTGMVIIDDLPDESSLYSKEQRAKIHERVYGTLMPIVEPGGYFIASGTPYHEADIYNDFKNDKNFKFFEYPAVMPDGRLLSPDRFTFDKLSEIRESLGSIVFTREYLVVPMTSDASIFPREILENSVVGMENVKFAHSVAEFPFKLTKVVLSCDFAISGKIGSDYSVFSVLGLDADENIYLLHMWRKQSSSFAEQVNMIQSLNQRFRPNRIVCETNGFQQVMADLVKQKGLRNVENFVTGVGKKDSYEGLPSLSAMFERYQIKIPYAEGATRDFTEVIFSEFASIGYIEDKGSLESTSEHDDIPMSMWIGISYLRKNTKKFKAYTA